MAGARTFRSLLLVVVLSLLVCLLLPATAGGGGGPCPRVPSMTAARACWAVCGTRHMRALCRRTLLPPRPPAGAGAAAVLPVTGLAAEAVRGALDAYAATKAAAESLVDGGAVKDGGEKAAYGDCMVGYGLARVAMSRLADDLAAGGCDGRVGADYMEGLRGMDMCSRGMVNYPASPLYAMNLADRNKTLLAALLCSLVAPPTAGRHVLG